MYLSVIVWTTLWGILSTGNPPITSWGKEEVYTYFFLAKHMQRTSFLDDNIEVDLGELKCETICCSRSYVQLPTYYLICPLKIPVYN
jgi:hypothetical protein